MKTRTQYLPVVVVEDKQEHTTSEKYAKVYGDVARTMRDIYCKTNTEALHCIDECMKQDDKYERVVAWKVHKREVTEWETIVDENREEV